MTLMSVKYVNPGGHVTNSFHWQITAFYRLDFNPVRGKFLCGKACQSFVCKVDDTLEIAAYIYVKATWIGSITLSA